MYGLALEREDRVGNLLVVLDEKLLRGRLGVAEIRAFVILDANVSIDDGFGLAHGDAAVDWGRECRGGKGKSRSDDGELHVEIIRI